MTPAFRVLPHTHTHVAILLKLVSSAAKNNAITSHTVLYGQHDTVCMCVHTYIHIYRYIYRIFFLYRHIDIYKYCFISIYVLVYSHIVVYKYVDDIIV